MKLKKQKIKVKLTIKNGGFMSVLFLLSSKRKVAVKRISRQAYSYMLNKNIILSDSDLQKIAQAYATSENIDYKNLKWLTTVIFANLKIPKKIMQEMSIPEQEVPETVMDFKFMVEGGIEPCFRSMFEFDIMKFGSHDYISRMNEQKELERAERASMVLG